MTRQGITEQKVEEVKSREARELERDLRQWLAQRKPIKDFVVPEGTVLHVAACKGYADILALLLQNGAPLEEYDEEGWTALHASVHWEQRGSIKQLVEAGANMEAVTFRGEIPAELTQTPEIQKLLEELKERVKTRAPPTGEIERGRSVTKRVTGISLSRWLTFD